MGLGRCVATGFGDSAAPGTVSIRAGEHYSDQGRAVSVGGAFEEDIDGRARKQDRLVAGEGQALIRFHEEVIVRRREITVPRLIGSLSSASPDRQIGTWPGTVPAKYSVLSGGTWTTTITARLNPPGKAGRMADNASSAPADAPITTAWVDRQSFDAPLIDLFFADELREGCGMVEKRKLSFAPSPKKPFRASESLNSPKARSCKSRSKYIITFRQEIRCISANTASVTKL